MNNKVSIIIINKNDRAIEATLKACNRQRIKHQLEIIVVDASEGKLDDIAVKFKQLKWISFSPLKHKTISIPEQRNVGVREASGDIIVFIDANCLPKANWLNNLITPILNQAETIVAGATFSQGKQTTHDNAYKQNKTRRYINECPTINLAFKRELFNKIGGFDERFDYGSDVDFSWRVIAAGYKVCYEPTAIVTHDWGDRQQEIRRSFLYGKARARLYHKHRTWKRLFSQDITLVIYPVYILGLPLTLLWPWYPLLLVIPMIKNFRQKPISTIGDHLCYGVGAIEEIAIELFRSVIKANKVTGQLE